MWRYLRKDNRWASVPRVGFTRSDEHKTEWPLTVERRSDTLAVDNDFDELDTIPSHAALEDGLHRSGNG